MKLFTANSKFIGSTLIVIGTAVGAGMLALPIISATFGFIWAVTILIIVGIVMTSTALLVLEVNLSLPENTIASVAWLKKLLVFPAK